MTLPEPPFYGSCLCGSVRVSVATQPLLTMACHCLDCQKLSASAFSMTTMFARDGFSFSGELIAGGLGSSGRTHYFCKSCLNFIFSEIGSAPERTNLRTSILDKAAVFDPFVELMTDEKMPWANVSAIHSFKQYPKSLQELQTLMDEYLLKKTRSYDES